MTSQQLWMLSACIGAIGMVLLAALLVWRLLHAARARDQIEKLLTLLLKHMIVIGWKLWAHEGSKARKPRMLEHNSMHCLNLKKEI